MKGFYIGLLIGLLLASAAGQVRLDMGTYAEGGRYHLLTPGLTAGKPNVEKWLTWSSEKVEPISYFQEENYVERAVPISLPAGTQSSEIVLATITPANTLAILHKLKPTIASDPIRLATIPDASVGPANTMDIVPPAGSNLSCTVENTKAQVIPYAVYCYNTTEPGELTVMIPQPDLVTVTGQECWKYGNPDSKENMNKCTPTIDYGYFLKNITTTTPQLPIPSSVFIPRWILVQYLVRPTNNDFSFSGMSNYSEPMQLNNSRIATDCVLEITPQEGLTVPLFFESTLATGSKGELIFLWEKPRFNVTSSDRINNTDIFAVNTDSVSGKDINVKRLRPQFKTGIDNITIFTQITDVRSFYNYSTGVVRFLISGNSSLPTNTSFNIWDCQLDYVNGFYKDCDIIVVPSPLSSNFVLANAVYATSNMLHLIYVNRIDNLDYRRARYLFNSYALSTFSTVLMPNYPMHQSKNFFNTDPIIQYGNAFVGRNYSYAANT